MLNVNSYYYFDRLDLSKKTVKQHDLLVSFFKDNKIERPLLTIQFKISEEEVLVNYGEKKLIIPELRCRDIKDDDWCYVVGCVNSKIKNGMYIEHHPIIHSFMEFKERDKEDNIILQAIDKTDIKDWEGLSGSPVFTGDGFCVGMCIRYSVYYNTVTVMPIESIIRLIKSSWEQEEK